MGIIAVQFAVQPMLTKRCIAAGTPPSSLVLAAESIKIFLCVVLLGRRGSAGWEVLHGWTLSGCLVAAGLPAIIFVVQNYCNQVAYQRLDPVAFNVVNQTKLAFTALFSRLIVGRRQSPVQCVALALVTLGGVLVSAGLGSSPIDAHHNEGNPRLGLLCALAAAALSGLSSGTMEGALQKRDAFLLSMEMAAIGCLVLLCSVGCPFTADGQMWRSEGLFTRWRPLTFVPVAVQGVFLSASSRRLRGVSAKSLQQSAASASRACFSNSCTGSSPRSLCASRCRWSLPGPTCMRSTRRRFAR